MTSVCDTATLTLIVFMLLIIQYGKNKILTLLLLAIVTKINFFLEFLGAAFLLIMIMLQLILLSILVSSHRSDGRVNNSGCS